MELIKVIFTSILSVVSMFIIAKTLGHKQVAQLDFFDYINGITIGSIAAELATELEKPWKPLIAMVIYGVLAFFLNITSQKFPKARKFLNGTPTIIMDNGKIYRKNMKKAKLELSEFLLMCRQEGYFNINDIQTAVFEYNGKLTILPKSTKRPVIPEDLNISPKKETLNTEVILDGRILHGNLKKLGLDLTWLDKQIKEQKYNNTKEIFLGICDDNNKLSLFPKNI